MNKSIGVRLSIVVIAAALAACTGSGGKPSSGGEVEKMEEKNSGFLTNYSKLTWSKDAQGNPVRTWISPKFTPANYNAVLLEPLKFYPEPQPTEQINADELKKMIAYSNEVLRSELGKRFVLVNKPAPGVVRLRAAISGVASEREGLKPYQYVPLALVVTATSRAASGAPQRAFILTESEATDSITNEMLGQRVKVGTGEGGKLKKIEGKEEMTLEMVKPVLDDLAKQALPNLERFVKPKPQ